MNPAAPPTEIPSEIPGLPVAAQARLLDLFSSQPRLEAVWLYGSRAMGRQGPGSDIDLCLEGAKLQHSDQLRLMAAIDDLLLPWQVDLSLRQQLPADLLAHIERVGRCIWRKR
ncbi:MAG: nucleotidyltransferase domain-containing protein [Synechococcus lacustris]|jgi:predicted nucleotidyltransferase